MPEYPFYPDATALAAADTWLILKSGGVTEEITALLARAYFLAAGSIVNADVSASAAIALSKLAADPLARANHTGTQLAATVSDLPPPIYHGFTTGEYYTIPHNSAAATITPILNRVYFVPFPVPVSTTFNEINISVLASAATEVIRLGIYTNGTNGKPTTLVLDAGTIDASTTGAKGIAISQALTPGWYWLCAVAQVVATATIRGNSGFASGVSGSSTAGSTTVVAGYSQSNVSGALPATTTTPGITDLGPKIQMKVA